MALYFKLVKISWWFDRINQNNHSSDKGEDSTQQYLSFGQFNVELYGQVLLSIQLNKFGKLRKEISHSAPFPHHMLQSMQHDS